MENKFLTDYEYDQFISYYTYIIVERWWLERFTNSEYIARILWNKLKDIIWNSKYNKVKKKTYCWVMTEWEYFILSFLNDEYSKFSKWK